MQSNVELSIVMPCLNEAVTLARCIGKARAGIEKAGVNGEIIVADTNVGELDGDALSDFRGKNIGFIK